MSALNPLHRSVYHGRVRIPRNMARSNLPDESRVHIEREALSIFTDMSNAGCSLQATLAAIFLSGMNAAMEANK